MEPARQRAGGPSASPPPPSDFHLPPRECPTGPALLIALAPALFLAALTLLPPVAAEPALRLSFLGAAGALVLWAAVLHSIAAGRPFTIDVAVRRQHWFQALVQLSIYAYWGFYWRI